VIFSQHIFVFENYPALWLIGMDGLGVVGCQVGSGQGDVTILV
jgi:hypothetical protein